MAAGAIPFVSGGGGYVRELHEGNELVETGNEIHATAGLKYWFGARRFGLRVEAGVTSREKGFDKREGRRTLPARNCLSGPRARCCSSRRPA